MHLTREGTAIEWRLGTCFLRLRSKGSSISWMMLHSMDSSLHLTIELFAHRNCSFMIYRVTVVLSPFQLYQIASSTTSSMGHFGCANRLEELQFLQRTSSPLGWSGRYIWSTWWKRDCCRALPSAGAVVFMCWCQPIPSPYNLAPHRYQIRSVAPSHKRTTPPSRWRALARLPATSVCLPPIGCLKAEKRKGTKRGCTGFWRDSTNSLPENPQCFLFGDLRECFSKSGCLFFWVLLKAIEAICSFGGFTC